MGISGSQRQFWKVWYSPTADIWNFFRHFQKPRQCGEVKGVLLRGGIIADFSWEEGRITELALTAKEDQMLTIRLNGSERKVILEKNVKKMQKV